MWRFWLGNINIMNIIKPCFESFLGFVLIPKEIVGISKLRSGLGIFFWASSNSLTHGKVVGQLITGPSWLTVSWMKKWDVSHTRWAK